MLILTLPCLVIFYRRVCPSPLHRIVSWQGILPCSGRWMLCLVVQYAIPVLCMKFSVIVWSILNVYRFRERFWNIINFILEFTNIFKIFIIWRWLSQRESHSLTIESMPNETCRPSQCGLRLPVIWVNVEWWNLYKYLWILCWVNRCGVSLRFDSVNVESHSTIPQITGVSHHIDSMCGRWNKPTQAVITISGRFKGTKFRNKISHERFKWAQYQSENASIFYLQ